MQNIWAPWRAEYFLNEKPRECVFCLMSSQRGLNGEPATDRANYVLVRERTCFAVLNAFPYSGGHLMVGPYRHTGELDDLTEDEMKDMLVLARRCKRALGRAFKPHGYNIGLNLGTAAGAGITNHLHLHVVPRWDGDTNFMTVLADARVVPEGLLRTYDKLMEHLKEEGEK